MTSAMPTMKWPKMIEHAYKWVRQENSRQPLIAASQDSMSWMFLTRPPRRIFVFAPWIVGTLFRQRCAWRSLHCSQQPTSWLQQLPCCLGAMAYAPKMSLWHCSSPCCSVCAGGLGCHSARVCLRAAIADWLGCWQRGFQRQRRWPERLRGLW